MAEGQQEFTERRVEVATIVKALESIQQQVSGIDVLTFRVGEIDERTKQISSTINGNGKHGLKTEVELNTEYRKTMSKMLWKLFTPVYGIIAGILIHYFMKM